MGGKPAVRWSTRPPRVGTNGTYLLELQLDRRRVHDRDRLCNVISNPKCLILSLPRQIDEQGVRVSIHDSCAPLLRGLNDSNRLETVMWWQEIRN